MNIKWDIRYSPIITYPLIRAVDPVSFNWNAVCAMYNKGLPPGAFLLSRLMRYEDGFCLSSDGKDGSNETIRQLRKVRCMFTPLFHNAFEVGELTRLAEILNAINPEAFVIDYQL